MSDFPLANQFAYCSRNVPNRYIGVHAVLIEQIDRFDSQALQGLVRDHLDVLRTAVQTTTPLSCIRVEVKTELGCNDDSSFVWRECFAYSLTNGP